MWLAFCSYIIFAAALFLDIYPYYTPVGKTAISQSCRFFSFHLFKKQNITYLLLVLRLKHLWQFRWSSLWLNSSPEGLCFSNVIVDKKPKLHRQLMFIRWSSKGQAIEQNRHKEAFDYPEKSATSRRQADLCTEKYLIPQNTNIFLQLTVGHMKRTKEGKKNCTMDREGYFAPQNKSSKWAPELTGGRTE